MSEAAEAVLLRCQQLGGNRRGEVAVADLHSTSSTDLRSITGTKCIVKATSVSYRAIELQMPA
jgi:hypothetical protein